jgi:hypothetical protein
MIKIPVPSAEYIEIPYYIFVPALWMLLLVTFRIIFGRCECGAWYHTEKDKEELWNYFWFTFLSSMLIFATLFAWRI